MAYPLVLHNLSQKKLKTIDVTANFRGSPARFDLI